MNIFHKTMDSIWRAASALLIVISAPAQADGVKSAPTAQALIDQARTQLVGSPESAIPTAENAAKLAQLSMVAPTRENLLSEADAIISRALISLGRIDEAESVIKRGFVRMKTGQMTLKVVGELTLSSGRLHQKKDDVQGALAAYQKAYETFRAAGERRSQAVALQSIAKLYVDSADGESAIKYYAQAEEEYPDDPQLALSSRNNRGKAYLLLERPRDAEMQFKRALVVAKQIGSAKYAPRILSNIAQAQIAQGRLNEATATVNSAFASIRTADSNAEEWRLWQRRAQIALARKDLKTATIAIEKALFDVDPKSSDSDFRETHAAAYEIYRDSGRIRESLTQLEAVWRLDQATAKLTATNAAALMAARFDFASQNTRIAQMKAKELELQRNFLVAVIAGGALLLLLLSIGLILITRSRNRERAAKLLLARTNRDLEKAIAAKMEFLATTSHEIRTPLNGILGMTQVMLADRKLGAVLRDRIGIVHDAGEAMRSLVDDILDVAKMETGKLAVGTGIVDLRATLGQVAQVWRLQAEATGVNLALDLDDCPDRIEGDAGRIRQIIFNLLSNAMKFTEKGTVELIASTVDVGEANRRVRISVRDSGIGIAPEWHESIFELFQQVDGGTTRKYGGTGLGLAICRNLARAMGGDISVTSEPGFGSTFTVDLPLIEPSEVAPAQVAEGAHAKTVLVIEQNPLTRGMMRAILSARFDVIAFVDDVAAAREYLALEQVDWVIADAASAEDFDILFAATDLPVVLVESREALAEDIRAKARIVLVKPLTKATLLNAFSASEIPVAVAA